MTRLERAVLAALAQREDAGQPGATTTVIVQTGIARDAAEALDTFIDLEHAGLVTRSDGPPWRYRLTDYGRQEADR